MIDLDKDSTFAGQHVSSVINKAIALADDNEERVRFTFNDTLVIVAPGDTHDKVMTQWDTDREAAYQALINSPEYKDRQAKQEQERIESETRVLVEASKTETEMRETKAPWPNTPKQLSEYINSLVDRQHDYGTAAYAMSLAASAAFNYVAHRLGTTGFQSGCADLDFIRRNRHIKGPFMLIKGEDALYPQYDLQERLNESLHEWKPWLKEQAAKNLKESGEYCHVDVKRHWEKLAS